MREMNLFGSSGTEAAKDTSYSDEHKHVQAILDLKPGATVTVDLEVVNNHLLPEIPEIKTGLDYKVVYVSPERVGIQIRPNRKRFWIDKQLLERCFAQCVGPLREYNIHLGMEFVAAVDGEEYVRGDCCQVIDDINCYLLNMETGKELHLTKQEVLANFGFII